jgi:DNA-binding protein YbaB
MIQDLVVAAVNEASKRVDEAMAGEIGNLASGLKLPGLG